MIISQKVGFVGLGFQHISLEDGGTIQPTTVTLSIMTVPKLKEASLHYDCG